MAESCCFLVLIRHVTNAWMCSFTSNRVHAPSWLWLIGPTGEKASEPKPPELFNIHSVMWQICACLGNRIPNFRANSEFVHRGRWPVIGTCITVATRTHNQHSISCVDSRAFRPFRHAYIAITIAENQMHASNWWCGENYFLPTISVASALQNVLHCKIVESKVLASVASASMWMHEAK